MNGYLGTVVVDVADTPYANYDKNDWALEYVEMYGQIDGDHHKTWVLDQVARILNGTPVIVSQASWDNGQTEYRIDLADPSPEYLAWVEKMLGDEDEDGEREYEYSTGCAP